MSLALVDVLVVVVFTEVPAVLLNLGTGSSEDWKELILGIEFVKLLNVKGVLEEWATLFDVELVELLRLFTLIWLVEEADVVAPGSLLSEDRNEEVTFPVIK